MVDVVSRLFSLLLITRLRGIKLHHGIPTHELDHELGHHGFNRVAHVRRHHGRTSIHLGRAQIKRRLCVVVRQGFQPLIGELAGPEPDSLFHLAVSDRQQFVGGHLCHSFGSLLSDAFIGLCG